jgi:dipeptidyl aminopeptidase/acylaminoacyl peptidase
MARHLFAVAFVASLLCVLASAPAGAAPPLEDYGKLPAVESMRLSPSGDKLAFFTVVGDSRQVAVRQVVGGVVQTVGTGELKARDIEWLDDNHLLIETSRTLGLTDNGAVYILPFEMFQATIFNVATGKLLNVFHNKQKIANATFGYYGHAESEGKSFGYFAGLSLTGSGESFHDFDSGAAYVTSNHADLFKVDLDSGYAVKVGGGLDRIDTRWVVSPRGEIAAHDEYEDKSGEWRLYADPDDKLLLAEGTSATREMALLGLGRTGGSVLVQQPAENDGGDWVLVEYDLTAASRGGPDTPKGVGPFGEESIRTVIRDPRTDVVIGGVSYDDDPKTILFDPAHQATFNAVRRLFPGERVTLVTASSDFKRLVARTEGPMDSGTYFLVDMTTKKVEAIAWDHPTILQADVATSKIVPYKAADGLEMQGVLTLPPGREPKNLPLIVMPHGGPEARDYLGFDVWAQAFASRGYAVFQPNFRGSDGFGRAFRDAGFGQWGRKMQTDISDGVAELARQGLIDPKRACIVGASYGGYAALAGVTVQQGLYRCAVSFGGVTDLAARLSADEEHHGERSAWVRYERLFLGVNSSSDSALKAISPVKLADKADAPILLAYGKDDTVVDIAQSRAMVLALKGAGKPVEALEIPNEDHWLSRQAGRSQLVSASVAFVERHNPAN